MPVVFQLRDLDEPLVSHYELQGDTVVVQMDAVSQAPPPLPSLSRCDRLTSRPLARFPRRTSCVWSSGSGAGSW